jgi:hypothetical protein
MLGTVGLKSAIDGPIRYRMFAGIDVAAGIAESQKETSYKSNLFGTGYSGKGKLSIGCSYKGCIWSKWVESIDYWRDWCNDIAIRLQNEEIDTTKIFEGALVPEVINERPAVVPYGIEWPVDMELVNDKSILVMREENYCPIYTIDIKISDYNESGSIRFSVVNEEIHEEYELHISDKGYEFRTIKPTGLMIKKGTREYRVTEFFKEFPPLIKFVDQSMLEGNLLVKINAVPPAFNRERIQIWDWTGINLRKESQGIIRDSQSIQYRVIQKLVSANRFCVVFDDDSAGEIADVVGIIEGKDKITFQFYHCKYAREDNPGARVADLYEVCGQAEKSVKWCQNPPLIIDRLIKRENLRVQSNATRFEVGDMRKLKEIKKNVFIPVKCRNIYCSTRNRFYCFI